MTGYSGTPLLKKLGIKPAMRVAFVKAPSTYRAQPGPLPADVRLLSRPGKNMDFVHLFCGSVRELRNRLPAAKASLHNNGVLWISWIKKSSGVPTDMTEADVRTAGLHCGLVDVRICAVDETWSALKFVYRLKDR